MLIEFLCQQTGNGIIHYEFSTFYGIRFNRNGFAVLSTEHSAHDYLLPMDDNSYESFVKELEHAIREGSRAVKISGDKVYRVRRGAILPLEDKRETNYRLEILN